MKRCDPRLCSRIALRGANQSADQSLPSLLPARRERTRCRAAQRGQQFPPSDDDCHTPLPCEVRMRKGTIPRHEGAVFTLKEGWTAAPAAKLKDERLSPGSSLASSV